MDFIRSSRQFSAATNTIHRMQGLSECINWAMELIDPTQYTALQQLRLLANERYLYLQALSTIDPLVMEGRAIMFNRQTPAHCDRLDPQRSWATMIVFGTFTQGGECYIPRLKLRIRYLPGDAIVIRGRLLEHEVLSWNAGQRISIAHFTHQSIWKEYGLTCP